MRERVRAKGKKRDREKRRVTLIIKTTAFFRNQQISTGRSVCRNSVITPGRYAYRSTLCNTNIRLMPKSRVSTPTPSHSESERSPLLSQSGMT